MAGKKQFFFKTVKPPKGDFVSLETLNSTLKLLKCQ